MWNPGLDPIVVLKICWIDRAEMFRICSGKNIVMPKFLLAKFSSPGAEIQHLHSQFLDSSLQLIP